ETALTQLSVTRGALRAETETAQAPLAGTDSPPVQLTPGQHDIIAAFGRQYAERPLDPAVPRYFQEDPPVGPALRAWAKGEPAPTETRTAIAELVNEHQGFASFAGHAAEAGSQ